MKIRLYACCVILFVVFAAAWLVRLAFKSEDQTLGGPRQKTNATAILPRQPSRNNPPPKSTVSPRQPEMPAPSETETVPVEPKAQRAQSMLAEHVGRHFGEESQGALRKFSAWTEALRNDATLAADAGFVAQGVALAEARRPVLVQLIATQPEAALAVAVPHAWRASLPAPVLAKIESWVEGHGDLTVSVETPPPGQRARGSTTRRTATIENQRYIAFVYGRRERTGTKRNIPMHGIALGRDLALAESPARVISRTAAQMGSHTVHAGTAPELASMVAEQMESENMAAAAPAANGPKTALVIRVDFSDLPGTPVDYYVNTSTGGIILTPQYIADRINNDVGPCLEEYSYHQTSLSTTTAAITDVLRMPQTGAYYSSDYDRVEMLYDDAAAAALAQGMNPDNYDHVMLVFSRLSPPEFPDSTWTWGGWGELDGKVMWLNGAFDTELIVHELGHNLGLFHANLWQVSSGTDPLSRFGQSSEYGDVFDMMGGGLPRIRVDPGQMRFNPWFLYRLGWLPSAAVTTVGTTGTYRLYRFDDSGANLTNCLALKIPRSETQDYWIGYRRKSPRAGHDMTTGAYVIWGRPDDDPSAPVSNLLDFGANPTDLSLTDASLNVGQTLNDVAHGIRVTPLASGGAGLNEYLDIQVEVGGPRIRIVNAVVNVTESSANAVVTLRRVLSSKGVVSLNYATQNGTAIAPSDYASRNGTLTWPDGGMADKVITIPIVVDAITEAPEFLSVRLSGITGGILEDGKDEAFVTIGGQILNDATFASQATVSSLLVPQPNGQVVYIGMSSAFDDKLQRLTAAGAKDTTFDSKTASFTGGDVNGHLRLADGRILAWGSFTKVGSSNRNGIALFNADGSLVTTFNPEIVGDNTKSINDVAQQPDGRFVVVGVFNEAGGVPHEGIVRLLADGSVDTGFAPDDTNVIQYSLVKLQRDGKMLVKRLMGGGEELVRLLPTGTRDATFNAATFKKLGGDQASPQIVCPLTDGKIVIGNAEWVADANNNPAIPLQRLDEDGTRDATFMPAFQGKFTALAGPSPSFIGADALPDGGCIVSGSFVYERGVLRRTGIVHFLPDGQCDVNFDSGLTDSSGRDVALLPDGKLLASPVKVAGLSRSIARYQSLWGAGPGKVQFISAVETCAEGQGAVVQVQRVGGSYGSVSVNYSTIPGTAAENDDYTPQHGTLTWAHGDTSPRIIVIPLLADALADESETFKVQLGVPLGGTMIGDIGVATVTIGTSLVPLSTTLAASNLAVHGAQVAGSVYARNGSCAVTFEYGLTTSYGNTVTAVGSPVSGALASPVSATITGLAPRTLYHYRVKAVNSAGTGLGLDKTFITKNSLPVSLADTAFALPSAKITLDVLANDSDPDGDPLSIYTYRVVSGGGVMAKVGNLLTYTPAATFTGAVLSYTVLDGFGGASTATVNVTPGAIALNPASVTLPSSAAGNHSVNIATALPWTVVEALTWASVTPLSGSGNGSVNVAFLANTSKASRSGIINIGGQPHFIMQPGTLGYTIEWPPSVPQGMVSADYTLTIPSLMAQVKFTAIGLPSGLVINATSGVITGKPNASGAFNAVVTGITPAGAITTITVPITVQPLPAMVVGTFNGLLKRDTTMSAPVATPPGLKLQGHGGTLYNLLVTATGVFTATLKIDDKSYPMPIGSRLLAHLAGNPTADVQIVRGTKTDAIADLAMHFEIDRNTGELTGTVTDGLPATTPMELLAWRNPWKVTGTAASPANPATALAGSYTAVIDADSSLWGFDAHPEIPQGTGYLMLKITTAGLATWTGKLADGSVLIGSTTMGPQGQVPLHQLLYTPTVSATAGSVRGWVDATPVINEEPHLDGDLDWLKHPQLPSSTTRSYKEGVPLHALTVYGGRYVKPPAGSCVLGMVDGGVGFQNARIEFFEAGIGDDAITQSMGGRLIQPFRITSANGIVMPTGLNNPATVIIDKLDVTTGTITGRFTLRDEDPTDTVPPITVLARTVTWYGVVVPRYGAAAGHFQLPVLPELGPPRTYLTTSKMYSGALFLDATP